MVEDNISAFKEAQMKIQIFFNKDTFKELKNCTTMILLLMIGRVIVGSHNLLLDFVSFVVMTTIYEILVFLVRKFKQRKVENYSKD